MEDRNTNSNYSISDQAAGFLRAARNGDLDRVIKYLDDNVDINVSNANGLNALHLASKEGRLEIVKLLLDRNAFVDSVTKKGNTALHIASLAGQLHVVELLIVYGANVDCRSQNGFTPLYMAAQENHVDVVRLLLANNANQTLTTDDGFTPLAVALQQGHDQVTSLLLENDYHVKNRLPALHIAAKKNDVKSAQLLYNSDPGMDMSPESSFTPLHIASHYGNIEIARFLISKGAQVNIEARQNITPLHVATKWGQANSVNLLLDHGAKIDAKTRDGLTPMHCSARSGHGHIIDLLYKRNAPINAKTKNGLTALHMAAQGDHVDAARILLNHSPKLVDQTTCDFLTALHVAAHCGHVKISKLLLDSHADVNAKALNGFTPLHIACKKNRIKVVELLIRHGASLESTTESGLTPLHVASFMGCVNVVEFLIQQGSQTDPSTVRGETPLHLASRANQTDIIHILLRHGAQVDAKAKELQTPLHIATRLGNAEIMSLLLRNGASVDAITSDGYTALHIASKESPREIAELLYKHGASLDVTTKKGFTPLHISAKYGNDIMSGFLLENNANPDIQGKNGLTPLHVATHYNRPNVALMLLQKGSNVHIVAKNGYSALHIAAKKNQIEIAKILLEFTANTNAESNAGFTPIHLACQEGHIEMVLLLLNNGAQPGLASKNGLTPLHLCAQEDRVNCAHLLVKSGAKISPQTKAGYTPLHIACHFGQINMVKFLLEQQTDINTTTKLGFTPLHCAAQQGHVLIVKLLLEQGALPDLTNTNGQTPLAIAQRLGYISVIEELKLVTQTTLMSTTIKTIEEKYKVQNPETMQETFISDSEDELGDDTAMLGDSENYEYSTNETDLNNNHVEDAMALTPKTPKKEEALSTTVSGVNLYQHLDPNESEDVKKQAQSIGNISKGESVADSLYLGYESNKNLNTLEPDNSPIETRPKDTGFLISFMVDARGGSLKGCRHSGIRVVIPPQRASAPTRITCRYVSRDKSVGPPINDSEALAARVLEMGPQGCRFLGPVLLEIPHYASLRDKEREITVLRSDNGEKWYEHTTPATDEAVAEILGHKIAIKNDASIEGLNDEALSANTANKLRVTRIITTDFPKYFALVSRYRYETHSINEAGGSISSTVVPKAQVVFPEKAIQKKIKLSLQTMPIPNELVEKMYGNKVAVSPIIVIEPRRRKFHKTITITMPLPRSIRKGMVNSYNQNKDSNTLRLLCSITGGSAPAQWEDITGYTPLSYSDGCVTFTTTVSAKFWLMDCPNVQEATKIGTELYREAIAVPFMCRFIVYAKRTDVNEAKLRIYCITDDKEEKALEKRENYVIVAKSKEVEVFENKLQWLEMVGNIEPVASQTGEQLNLNFRTFRENRLPFTVKIKNIDQAAAGRLVFLKEPMDANIKQELRSPPVCTLDIQLPSYNRDALLNDEIKKKKILENGVQFVFLNESGMLSPVARSTSLLYSQANGSKIEFNLRLLANDLNNLDKQFDWINLAQKLKLTNEEIDVIKHSSSASPNIMTASEANLTYEMLKYWIGKYKDTFEIENNTVQAGDILHKALLDLNIDEEIINRNTISSSFSSNNNILNSNTNLNSSTQLENIYSVEKSFGKLNLNTENDQLNGQSDVSKNQVLSSQSNQNLDTIKEDKGLEEETTIVSEQI